ncbi:MAG: hypothetical protein WAV54_04155, partial [Acidimicrobiales bacterium]
MPMLSTAAQAAVTITQVAPFSGTTTTGNAFTDQLATTGGTGSVTYDQLTGTPSVTVSSTGAVSAPGTLTAGVYTATGSDSDTDGDSGSWSYTLTVGIAQTAPFSGTTTTVASSTFTDQLATTGGSGTVVYTQSSGSSSVKVSSTGKVTTQGTLAAEVYTATGSDSDTDGDSGSWSYTLTVGTTAITQTAPFSGTIASGSAFADQLATTGGTGTVSYYQLTGTPSVTVSTSGKVSVPGTLTAGVYTATGSDSDTDGDSGSWSYTLTVGIAQTAPFSGTTTTAASSTFTGQLTTTGGTGAVSYDQLTGSSSVKVSTSGKVSVPGTLVAGVYTATGSDSDTDGDSGSWSYTLTVTATPITQATPTTGTVSVPDSSAFTGQLATTGATGAVSYVQSSGSSSVKVSSSGKVSVPVPVALAKGSYTAKGTDSDIYG